jgi:hypothetical protein
MRRLWAVALASALLALTAVAGPASAAGSLEASAACGCGAVAPTPGTTAEITSESAVISLKDGVQTIALSLGVESALPSLGLVVPTPTPATVVAGDPALFDAVDAQTQPTPRYVEDWWGTLAEPEQSEPTVVSRVLVGDYEATTLAASDGPGLQSWLQARGYELPAGTPELLAGYVAQGWQFVAIKLANDSALDGRIDPIQISFATPTMIYPLGLSRAAGSDPEATGQSLRLSVFSDHRVDLVRAGTQSTPLNAAESVVWAGPVTDESLLPLGAYLTVVDLRFDNPAAQVVSDIGIVAAVNDDPVTPTVVVVRPVTLLGFPLATLLVVWGGLGLLAAAAAVIARSRLR